ncbi:MAG: hypothetical protein AAFU54_14145 [Chloroflexota bacterium]
MRAAALAPLVLTVMMLTVRGVAQVVAPEPPSLPYMNPACDVPCWYGVEPGTPALRLQARLDGMGVENQLQRHNGLDATVRFRTDEFSGMYRLYDDQVEGFVLYRSMCVADVLVAHDVVPIFDIHPDGTFVLIYMDEGLWYNGFQSAVSSVGYRNMDGDSEAVIRENLRFPGAWRSVDRYFRSQCDAPSLDQLPDWLTQIHP